MIKFCGKCGARALPGARFCRSCGNKLEKDEVTSKSYSEPTLEDETLPSSEPVREQIQPKEPVRKKEPTFVKVELTKEEEESLLILSEIIPIQKKAEELSKEKDTLEIQFRVEETITEKEYNAEIKRINAEIAKFEKEITEKRKAMSSVTLLNFVQEVIDMRERQEKLESIYKEKRIQDGTYERLKKEYRDKEKSTQAKVTAEETKLKQYRENLLYDKNQSTSLKEEFYARYSVGEFTDEEYQAKIADLDKRNIDGLIAAVDEVLARIIKT